MAFPILGILGSLVPSLTSLVSEFVEDPDKKNEIESRIRQQLAAQEAEVRARAADIVLAEVKGESWEQRKWRPHLMYTGMFVIIWTGILAPIIDAFFGVTLPIVDIFAGVPAELWQLLMIGMGGYVAGRTGEKMMKTYVEGKKE